MKGTTSSDPRLYVSMAVAENLAAVALGLFGVALLSGRAVFAVVVGVGILAILFSPRFVQTAKRFREAASVPLVVASAAVLAAWLPSTVLSELPWTSVQVHIRMVLFLVLGVLIYAYFVGRPAALNLLFKTLFISLAAGLAVAIPAILAFPGLSVLLTARVPTGHEHTVLAFKGAASAAIVLIPLVLWAGWWLGGRWRAGGVALAAALLVLTSLAGSRAGLAGLIGAVGITLFALTLRQETRRWGGWFFLVLVVVVGAIGIYLVDRDVAMVVPEQILNFPPWLIDPHRQIIWSFAMDLTTQHPWVGWGINTINLVPPAVASPASNSVLAVMPGHPHNWIIEVFAETGVVGGIPMVVTVVSLFIVLLRRYRATGDLRLVALLAASAAFWASSLFNFSFWSAWWQVCYVLILALLCAGRSRLTEAREPAGSSPD